MSYYCTQCGTKVINDDALFCHKCGAALAHAFNNVVKPMDEQSPPADSSIAKQPIISYSNEQFDENEEEFKEKLKEELNIESSDDNTNDNDEEFSEEFKDEPEDESAIAVAAVKTEKPVPEKKKRRRNPLIAILGIILSIMLFIAVTAGQAWFVLNESIQKKAVKAAAKVITEEVDFSSISVPGFVNEKYVTIPGVDARIALPDAIYGTIDDYYREIFGVESDHIRELLQSDVFRSFLGAIIDDGAGYITGNDSGVIVTSARIVELIQDNKDEIEDITSYTLVESDFDDIKKVLTESGLDALTWDLATDTPDTFLIRNAFSIVDNQPIISLVSLIAVIVILIALLAVINRRRISNTLLYFGIPFIVSGGVFIACRLIGADLISRRIISEFGVDAATMNSIMSAFSGTESIVLYSGIIVAGAGIIAVIIRIILHGLRKKLII
ncbi:MAG: zinc ribbon domain-containing protein [Oscillospiraceae bacterium]|nr:zinc ribbon domain-containing protein [Oscillospiraceae bacterium]